MSSFMLALLAHLEESGGLFVGGTKLLGVEIQQSGSPFLLEVEDTVTKERSTLLTDILINSGGKGCPNRCVAL